MNIKIIRVILFGWVSASLFIPSFYLNIYLSNNNSMSYEWDIQSLNTSQDEHHWKRIWNNGWDYLYDMEIDSEENIYLYGSTTTPEYSREMCLLKYNTSGDLQWVKKWKSPHSYWGLPLTIDSLDNIYITGSSISQDTGYTGISLLKCHSNGTILFNKTLSAGDLYSEGLCIASDSFNNMYVGGYTGNNLSEYMYDTDAVLVKYNQSGDPLWGVTVGADYDYQEFDQLEIDSHGNVYALYFTDNHYYTGELDAYVLKFSINGTFQWSRLGEQLTYFFCIALDSGDNVYFLKEGGGIEKVNSSGSRIWQRSHQGFNSDLVVDNQDNLYILGGYFSNQILFPEDMGYNSIKKYDNQGNLLWNMRGVERETELWEKIIVDTSENIYIGGESRSDTNDLDFLLIKNPQLFEIDELPGLYELAILIGLPIGLIVVIGVLILTTKRK